MKIYSILLFKNKKLLHRIDELSTFGYFYRNSISEFILFFSGLILNKTEYNKREVVTEKEYIFYSFKYSDNSEYVIVCDKEYPEKAAFLLINDIHRSHDKVQYIDSAIVDFQNPMNVDKLMKIQDDLEKTITVVKKTIDSVLDRGVKLETLIQQSEDLSISSKKFYETAAKQNRCCSIS